MLVSEGRGRRERCLGDRSGGVGIAQGESHNDAHLLEMPGSEEVGFLPVEASSVKDGTGHGGLTLPGDGDCSDPAGGRAQALQFGVHEGV